MLEFTIQKKTSQKIKPRNLGVKLLSEWGKK